jgi:hypothetical protein
MKLLAGRTVKRAAPERQFVISMNFFVMSSTKKPVDKVPCGTLFTG